MQDLNPAEFLSLWRQTGVEPAISQLNLSPILPQDSHSISLSVHFSQVLLQAVRDHPSWVKNVLTSKVADVLKASETNNLLSVLTISYQRRNPWFSVIDSTLKRINTDNDFPQEGVEALTKYIKDNLDEFRGLPHPHTKRSKIVSLLLGLSSLKKFSQKNDAFAFGVEMLDQVLPLCTDKERSQFVSALLKFDCTPERVDFVVDQISKYNIVIKKDELFYSEVLHLAISGIDGVTSSHQEKVIDLLKDKKLRNKTIKRMLTSRSRLGWGINSSFPSLDQFCALLPKEDLPALTKCILSSPAGVDGLPCVLKASMEKEQIYKSLKDPPLLKFKKVLFSSRPTKPQDHQLKNTPAPRKKM